MHQVRPPPTLSMTATAGAQGAPPAQSGPGRPCGEELEVLHVSGAEMGMITRKGAAQTAADIMQDAMAERDLAQSVQRFLRQQQQQQQPHPDPHPHPPPEGK